MNVPMSNVAMSNVAMSNVAMSLFLGPASDRPQILIGYCTVQSNTNTNRCSLASSLYDQARR